MEITTHFLYNLWKSKKIQVTLHTSETIFVNSNMIGFALKPTSAMALSRYDFLMKYDLKGVWINRTEYYSSQQVQDVKIIK